MTVSSLIQPCRVWLRRGHLDRGLAQGANPSASPELARRARQLTSPRFRAGLAAGLRRMVEAAEERPAPFSAQVPLNRRDILRERELFEELARDLSSGDEVSARGVALVERLVLDCDSPCFMSMADDELNRALRHARAALHLA